MNFNRSLLMLAFVGSTYMAGAATLSRGPYLQLSTEDSIVVVWRTQGESQPALRYGLSPDELNNEVSATDIFLKVSVDVDAGPDVPRLYQEPVDEQATRKADHDPSTSPNTYQYEATLSGLEPGVKYFYAIYDDDQKLAGQDDRHFLSVNPPIGTPTDVRLWVVGDSGTGGANQKAVNDSMLAYVERTNRPADYFIHVGDMAYSDGTDFEFQRGFFVPYESTLQNTVCWPAMGNHEGHTSRGLSGIGPYYDAYVLPTNAEAGGVPSGTEAYYSFDIADAHFVCLDSHDLDRDPNAAMATWLRADLEQTNAKWLIAIWHHPAYTMGSHNSDRETQLIEMRENFMPILESAGVDLTLTGHSHIYERSMLIDGAYETPTTADGVILDDGDGRPNGNGAYRKSVGLNPHEGTVAIVAGHGGAGLGREGTLPIMREVILEHGSVFIDIKDDTLQAVMINSEGTTRDLFSIVKRGSVQPTVVENPWQPLDDPSMYTSVVLEFEALEVDSTPNDWKLASTDSQLFVGEHIAEEEKILIAQAKTESLFALYKPWGTRKLDLETVFRVSKKNGIGTGLIFGYQDTKNYFSVFANVAEDKIVISRITDGHETIIDQRAATMSFDQWIGFEIEVSSSKIEVQMEQDGNQIESLEYVVDHSYDLPKAQLGFLVSSDETVEFKFFEIERND